MDSVIDRLKQQTDEFDASGLDPQGSLTGVVSRGRRYMVVVTAVSVLGASAAVAAAAVAVPQIVQQVQGPSQPTVMATPDDGDVPAPVEDEPSEAPVDDETEPSEKPSDEPSEAADSQSQAPAPADVTGPGLVVLKPADGSTVDSEKVTFSGTTEPGAQVTVGSFEANVDADGNWSIMLIASPGANTVTFEATDAAGNATAATVTVTYRPQTTVKEPDNDKPSTDKPSSDATLTATQQKSTLNGAPHTNTYSGTAAPGAKVAVVSDHGTGYGWADDSGRWNITVDFNPPAGTKTFPVTVKLYHQPKVTKTFQLTTVAEGSTQKFTANQQKSTLNGPYTNTYSGTANPDEKIKVISDYGWAYAYADGSGNWQVQVTFDPPAGTKTFPVTARYYHNSSVSKTFQLTTVADEAAAFTASQKSGSVSASNPTNIYSGTGQPGHEVLIWTENHGQTSTVIGGDGTWQTTITYSGAASGETFSVKALDTNTGKKHYFEVTITK